MAFIGCDVKQIGLRHSTLGSVSLFPKAGENAQIDLGGLTTESDKKGITGAGQAIYKQSIGRWALESPPIAWNRSGVDTLATVQDMSDSFEELDVTIELADGSVYVGKGKIVDELKGATFDATIPLKIEGSGKLSAV